MPYDEEWFAKYREYLKEKTVRENHDRMFGHFSLLLYPRYPYVVDLGCGIAEYKTYGKECIKYIGIDLKNVGNLENFIEADYKETNFMHLLPFAPNAFISLFSIECCFPVDNRYKLYEKLFEVLPSVRCVMASGFFYESKRRNKKVSETGGIVSYQTIENPARYISDIFIEERICIKTPSQMFGGDVVEVWKFFERR